MMLPMASFQLWVRCQRKEAKCSDCSASFPASPPACLAAWRPAGTPSRPPSHLPTYLPVRHARAPPAGPQPHSSLVNPVGSMHALVASPFKSAYNAAKHGIAGFTKTAALEVSGGQACGLVVVGWGGVGGRGYAGAHIRAGERKQGQRRELMLRVWRAGPWDTIGGAAIWKKEGRCREQEQVGRCTSVAAPWWLWRPEPVYCATGDGECWGPSNRRAGLGSLACAASALTVP